jgi:uncharacterized membrane protein YphA (DoxX/SURF4 family)
MHKWQFWEDGITGIVFIVMGISFVFTPSRVLKTMFAGKGLSPQKIKGKRKLFIIGGVVFILFGILLLVGYISL